MFTMTELFTITFKGETAENNGLRVAKRPSIPAPIKRGEFIEIEGRDGALFQTDGKYSPITFPIEMNYVKHQSNQMGEGFRKAKRWLKGSGELIMNDDSTVFYKVINCNIIEHDRRAKWGADVFAEFTCDPYTYYISGKDAISVSGSLTNDYDETQPIYKIIGSGDCTLSVNGNTLDMTIDGNINIDTMLFMSYKDNGTLQNNVTSGADYQDLFLKEGENTISVSNGFTLSVIPNWRSL